MNFEFNTLAIILTSYSVLVTVFYIFNEWDHTKTKKELGIVDNSRKKLAEDNENLKRENEDLKNKNESLADIINNLNNKSESNPLDPSSEHISFNRGSGMPPTGTGKKVTNNGNYFNEGHFNNQNANKHVVDNSEPVVERSEVPPTSITRKLYAGSFNDDANTFYSVNDTPTDKTLFVLSVNVQNNAEAELDVYPEAVEKLLGCKDHLKGVCDYSGSGNILVVEEKGRVILDGNNWRIDKKAIIKFSIQ